MKEIPSLYIPVILTKVMVHTLSYVPGGKNQVLHLIVPTKKTRLLRY